MYKFTCRAHISLYCFCNIIHNSGEIEIVQQISRTLPNEIPTPEIIYANPCKGRGHIIDAVCRGVRLMTFDNVAEIYKCAEVSKKIQLIMRIITDDSGSQCRLSSKFGAPPQHWPILLAEAKRCGLDVVGVSFHVGSGCRDATRYKMALKDCKTLFEMAKKDYGFNMTILDIGGGFPGETHSLWSPAKVRMFGCRICACAYLVHTLILDLLISNHP